MSPERMAALVARWVRVYTRDLPGPIAERRIAELDADLHDHIAHERASGLPDRRIALGIAGRMVRGLPADASWRGRIARTHARKDTPRMQTPLARSAVRVALVTALVLLIPAVLMLAGEPGTDWGVFDFVFAGVLVMGAGMLVELAVRRPSSVLLRVVAAVVGAAAIALGEADDAPGLMLFGVLLIGGALALSARTALRDS